MEIRDIINDKREKFVSICTDHKVKYLYIFGSAITDRFDPESSDIDLIVSS